MDPLQRTCRSCSRLKSALDAAIFLNLRSDYEAFATDNKYSETCKVSFSFYSETCKVPFYCHNSVIFETSRLLAKSRKGLRRMWRDS